MKKLLFFFLLLSTIIKAQDSLNVIESDKKFSGGEYNSFSVKIPQTKFKEIKSDWKKYLHEKGKINPKESDGEYVLKGTVVQDISKDTILSYSIVKENLSGVEVSVCFGNNQGEFYSSLKYPEIAERIKKLLRNFAVTEYKTAVNYELSAEEKKLSLLEQNLTDLENQNVKYDKTIKSNERSIENLNSDVKSNKTLHDIKSDAIDQQQRVLATFTSDSDMKRDEEKKLKSMQKEKKKIEKENESLHKDIEEKEDLNKSMKKTIDKNTEENIPNKKKEIEKQREHVVEVETKLKNIK
jgi:hypothetical protein